MATESDQTRIYREYLEIVKAFDVANEEYTTKVNKAEQQRQNAVEKAEQQRRNSVEKAIKVHMNPLISNLRGVQVGSVILLIIPIFLMCNIVAIRDPELRVLMVLGAFGLGVVGLVGLIWSSSKIATLVSETRRAKDFFRKSSD